MNFLKRHLLPLLNRVIADKAPRNFAIEVCSACNHRCVYCPVHKSPFRQKVMPLEDFITILDKLKKIPRIRRIALNHYNEPFMDPHIVERIQEIFARKMTRWVILYTNGSMIRPEQLKAFYPFRKQLGFNINLPTVLSDERYKEVHGRNDLPKVEANLERLIREGFLVQINVQGNQHTTGEDYHSVVGKYGKWVKKISWIPSSTRSNLVLDKKYAHQGKLVGCTIYRHRNYLHVGVDGSVFLCAEDYYQKSRFGNILHDPLEKVLDNPQRNIYLDYLSGKKEAPADFLCRSCKHAIVVDEPSNQEGGLSWLREILTSNNLFNKF